MHGVVVPADGNAVDAEYGSDDFEEELLEAITEMENAAGLLEPEPEPEQILELWCLEQSGCGDGPKANGGLYFRCP